MLTHGTFFVGLVADAPKIKKIVVDDLDNDAGFRDANLGFDSFRMKAMQYPFTGFFQPVDNPGPGEDVVNLANAGWSIPAKFSLGSDLGLLIFRDGYPKFITTACDAGDTQDPIGTRSSASSEAPLSRGKR